jgi:threonine/homoserine/homoserine lactone efflux protein
MTPEQKHDTVVQVVMATPTVITLLWTKVLALHLTEWVQVVAIVSGCAHLLYLLWKWWGEWRDRRARLAPRRRSTDRRGTWWRR